MAKTMSQSCGCKERKTAVKPENPKKLSKYGEWCLKHPHGIGGTYDMRAVMK